MFECPRLKSSHMTFVKKFTQPQYLGTKFYTKKKVIQYDIGRFTSKQHKCFPGLLYLLINLHTYCDSQEEKDFKKIEFSLISHSPFLQTYLVYLGAPNMVKWGVPEKILQNAVQTCWSQVNRTLQSKIMTKSIFLADFPIVITI